MRTLLITGLGGALLLCPPLAAAQSLQTPSTSVALSGSLGRPEVVLDRLEFPAGIKNANLYKRHLRKVLRKEARRADWGAGRNNRIEYRFSVEQLRIEQLDDVLRVSCSAVGRLPKGKTAKSNLTFGGSPSEQQRVVKRVLEIVARGVITRLAQLERRRRGLES